LAVTLLLGQRPGVGNVLVTFGAGAGIHAGDLPVIGLWLLAAVCGVLLWRARS
jgi:hypothetical protein